MEDASRFCDLLARNELYPSQPVTSIINMKHGTETPSVKATPHPRYDREAITHNLSSGRTSQAQQAHHQKYSQTYGNWRPLQPK